MRPTNWRHFLGPCLPSPPPKFGDKPHQAQPGPTPTGPMIAGARRKLTQRSSTILSLRERETQREHKAPPRVRFFDHRHRPRPNGQAFVQPTLAISSSFFPLSTVLRLQRPKRLRPLVLCGPTTANQLGKFFLESYPSIESIRTRSAPYASPNKYPAPTNGSRDC